MLGKLLSTPTAQLGRAGRLVVFQIKLWSHCARLLRINRAGQQAAALSYHTIFGLVPLAIVTLLIFQGLDAYSGYAEKIKDFVYDQANLSAFESLPAGGEDSQEKKSLTEHMDDLIEKFFTGVSTGLIKLVSVLFVIWAAFGLLSTIEKAFNNIWHVGRGRGFLHRIINYWAVLTLGPLVIAVSVYLAMSYLPRVQIKEAALIEITRILFSYLVAGIVLFLLYFILPNTRVKPKAAVWGAAVAALVWIAAKNAYQYSVTELGLYRTVYGVLALVPVTVFWIYITWLIVLFGLQLTFTTQHLTSLDAAEMATAEKRQEHFIANDLTAINILREIAGAFQTDKAPIGSEVICSKLDIPAEFGDKILNHFVDRGLIAKTSEPRVGFIPAKDPVNVKLSDIAAVVAQVGLAQSTPGNPQPLEQISQSQQKLLEQYTLKQILQNEQRREEVNPDTSAQTTSRPNRG
jgi:membrane protein